MNTTHGLSYYLGGSASEFRRGWPDAIRYLIEPGDKKGRRPNLSEGEDEVVKSGLPRICGTRVYVLLTVACLPWHSLASNCPRS